MPPASRRSRAGEMSDLPVIQRCTSGPGFTGRTWFAHDGGATPPCFQLPLLRIIPVPG